ncbi:fused MFS/spermidine synthase [Gammaproteobacteria bacterium]|nr:fused MFS/spermidine synthase [Gammaproteobacteria bacterium]
MRVISALYLIIFLEGYVVLSTELLAIRQLTPFVGNGTETVAIVIGAVLLPLALGYYHGGMFRGTCVRRSIRTQLLSNVFWAGAFITLGLSYVLMEGYFQLMEHYGITHRVIQTALYTMVFLLYPIYLLGQTVPLISHYFRGNHLSQITGRILTCSTMGSFLGSILATLLVMPFLGVNFVLVINMGLLVFITLILGRSKHKKWILGTLVLWVMSYMMNEWWLKDQLGIVKNNAYHMIQIVEQDDARYMLVNRSNSAVMTDHPDQQFEYIKHVEKKYLQPLLLSSPPKSILVIGAGGFTFGRNDTNNVYTYIDVDESIKEVAERHFLKRPLRPNHHFISLPARSFLRQIKDQYDLVFLDAYTHGHSMPMQLLTREFFVDVKSHMKPNGTLICNVIASGGFKDQFSKKIDNTLRSVFQHMGRHVVNSTANTTDSDVGNIIYSYVKQSADFGVYTDQKMSYMYDH